MSWNWNWLLPQKQNKDPVIQDKHKPFIQRIAPSPEIEKAPIKKNDQKGPIALNQDQFEDKSNDVDIGMVEKAIKKFETKLNAGLQADHIVIFWGHSGTGKSTTIILLNGQEMIGYHNQKTKQGVLINKSPSTNEDDVRIQTNVEGGTAFPAVLELKYLNGQSTDKTVRLWDMPGFGDNRGLTQILINTYFIHRIFALHDHVKLAFTISYPDIKFGQKGKNLLETIKQLTNAFSAFKNYHKCMTLIITKANQLIDKNGVKQAISQLTKKIPEIKNNPKVKQFFQFVTQGKIPIVIVRQANLPSQKYITKQNSMDVNYSQTIKEFYNIVDKQLQQASFPHLQGPATINKQAKLKCKGIANQTKIKMEASQNIFVQQLSKFISKMTPEAFIFPQTIDESKALFKDIKSMNKFVKDIYQIISSIKKEKEQKQFIHKFNLLRQYVEQDEYRFLCQHDKITNKYICKPMVDISNQFIIVDFLTSISFKSLGDQYKWVDKMYCIQEFFKKIQNQRKAIQLIIKNKNQKFQTSIKQFINKQFESSLKNIQKSAYFKMWNQNMRTLPAFFLCNKQFSKAKNTSQFFQEYQRYQQTLDFDVSQTKVIRTIIDYYIDCYGFNPNYQTTIELIVFPLVQKYLKSIVVQNQNVNNYKQIQMRGLISKYSNEHMKETDQYKSFKKQEQYKLHEKAINQLVGPFEANQSINNKINKLIKEYSKIKEKSNKMIKEYQQIQEKNNKMIKEYSQIKEKNNKMIKEYQQIQEKNNKKDTNTCCQIM